AEYDVQTALVQVGQRRRRQAEVQPHELLLAGPQVEGAQFQVDWGPPGRETEHTLTDDRVAAGEQGERASVLSVGGTGLLQDIRDLIRCRTVLRDGLQLGFILGYLPRRRNDVPGQPAGGAGGRAPWEGQSVRAEPPFAQVEVHETVDGTAGRGD